MELRKFKFNGESFLINRIINDAEKLLLHVKENSPEKYIVDLSCVNDDSHTKVYFGNVGSIRMIYNPEKNDTKKYAIIRGYYDYQEKYNCTKNNMITYIMSLINAEKVIIPPVEVYIADKTFTVTKSSDNVSGVELSFKNIAIFIDDAIITLEKIYNSSRSIKYEAKKFMNDINKKYCVLTLLDTYEKTICISHSNWNKYSLYELEILYSKSKSRDFPLTKEDVIKICMAVSS